MLAKNAKILKKTVRRHIGFYPILKLTRSARTEDKPRRAPVRLDGESVSNLERRFPYEIAVPMQKRLQDGHECYALGNDDGEYESFVWIASGHGLYASELGTYVWVPDEVAYLYDAFTWPESCGRGLFTQLAHSLANSGVVNPSVKRFEAWVDRDNKASRRAFEKAGFKVYGSYTAAMVGPVRMFTGRPWIEDFDNYTPDEDSAPVKEQRVS